ncbi:hypothetical protein D3C84_949120 [compost metagenome]|jgi:hypothetical protein
MANFYPPGYCPDKCSGGQSDRQVIVAERLQSEFPEAVRGEITAHGGAKRCNYCGLVYLHPIRAIDGRLGFWDSGVRGTVWNK